MEKIKSVKGKSTISLLKFQEKSDFKEILLPILQNNDYLMIKGSNATGLKKITENLTKGRINAI